MHVTLLYVFFTMTPDDLARQSRKFYGVHVNLTLSLCKRCAFTVLMSPDRTKHMSTVVKMIPKLEIYLNLYNIVMLTRGIQDTRKKHNGFYSLPQCLYIWSSINYPIQTRCHLPNTLVLCIPKPWVLCYSPFC